MIATWLGGPFDGRTDEIPNGSHTVAVAHPTGWASTLAQPNCIPYAFVEVYLPIRNTDRGWVIVWKEP